MFLFNIIKWLLKFDDNSGLLDFQETYDISDTIREFGLITYALAIFEDLWIHPTLQR